MKGESRRRERRASEPQKACPSGQRPYQALVRSRSGGQSTVEFGIIAVLFFLLVSGIIDFGRIMNAWIVVSTSAREAARQAAVGKDPAEAEATARGFAMVPGVNPSDTDDCATDDVCVEFQYSDPDGTNAGAWCAPSGLGTCPNTKGDSTAADPGDRVTVRVTAQFEIVTPLVRVSFGCPPAGVCTIPIGSATTIRYEGLAI